MNTQTIKNFTGKQAIERLLIGNKRFVASEMTYPNQTPRRRTELITGQYPFAVILGCSDSRVPPEVIFDQGLGDLFVIRVAGNILDDIVLGSIEYAVQYLQTPLVMVLGHSDCGAVKAAIARTELKGHLSLIAFAIQPAITNVKNHSGDSVEDVVRANAINVAEQIRSAKPLLAEYVQNGKVTIIAAKYDLQTGVVEML